MDFIYIYDEFGNKRKMEIVSIFNIEDSEYSYFIYKESNNSRFYLAKYKDSFDDVSTDISDREYKICNTIFKGVISWN